MDKKIFPALININSSLHTAQGEAEGQITSTNEMALAYEPMFSLGDAKTKLKF